MWFSENVKVWFINFGKRQSVIIKFFKIAKFGKHHFPKLFPKIDRRPTTPTPLWFTGPLPHGFDALPSGFILYRNGRISVVSFRDLNFQNWVGLGNEHFLKSDFIWETQSTCRNDCSDTHTNLHPPKWNTHQCSPLWRPILPLVLSTHGNPFYVRAAVDNLDSARNAVAAKTIFDISDFECPPHNALLECPPRVNALLIMPSSLECPPHNALLAWMPTSWCPPHSDALLKCPPQNAFLARMPSSNALLTWMPSSNALLKCPTHLNALLKNEIFNNALLNYSTDSELMKWSRYYNKTRISTSSDKVGNFALF